LIGREATAAYVCVSTNTFDDMVADGRMPLPKRVSDRRKAWDVRELDAAVDKLPHVSESGMRSDETWSDVDAPQPLSLNFGEIVMGRCDSASERNEVGVFRFPRSDRMIFTLLTKQPF
jgi:predicted DNA-binding transcriptional regulator AlpA